MKQIVIHTKEVAVIKGVSNDTARKLLQTIKDVFEKKPHQSVTIREFCDYEGLPYDEVFAMINGATFPPNKSSFINAN